MCVLPRLHVNGETVRRILIGKYGTGVIFIHGVIRLAYSAVAKEKIPALFENVYHACRDAAGAKQE
jgi:hypothetical protein